MEYDTQAGLSNSASTKACVKLSVKLVLRVASNAVSMRARRVQPFCRVNSIPWKSSSGCYSIPSASLLDIQVVGLERRVIFAGGETHRSCTIEVPNIVAVCCITYMEKGHLAAS